MSEPIPAARPPSVVDLEIKDAQLIFSAVWTDLLEKYGRENLKFPGEVSGHEWAGALCDAAGLLLKDVEGGGRS